MLLDVTDVPREDPDDTKQYVAVQLKEKRQMAMKDLADFSEKSCEQMLRISEIFLMRIAEEKLKREDQIPVSSIVNYAQSLREFTIVLLTVIC